MELQHINIENLNTTTINVRKKGAKDIGDILPSIRSLGVLQPLLVRPNKDDTKCQGFEIVAGQRRFYAVQKLAEEAKESGISVDPLPCIVMEAGDDAKAIEASLAENIARLPMDEIDQYKAFSALSKQGQSVEYIASQFGISKRLVTQRLAIANLILPILNAYRAEKINAMTIRQLTMATKKQQKEWLELFNGDGYAPQGSHLKEWLFGGADIQVDTALFDLETYKGGIITDLFSENRYFDDAPKFWELQNIEIAKAKERYLDNGWSQVNILEVGESWYKWDFTKIAKTKGGAVYIEISRNGEVTFNEGYLTTKAVELLKKAESADEDTTPVLKPELTKAMQNYLDLHRHSAVRTELLNHSGVALRLCVAQMIAGSSLWSIKADAQKANTEVISHSLETNNAEDKFDDQRQVVRDLLGCGKDTNDTLVQRKEDWKNCHDLYEVFAKLIALTDEQVTTIITFVVAETLPNGSAMVEVLGEMLCVDMMESWSPDDAFFDLLRDKEAINAIIKHVGTKASADGNISATAKVQKGIIRDYLDGTRTGGKKDWEPRYMRFPMASYTKRGGIEAMSNWKSVKKHFC
ncbi:MAG: ParB/RepB/Spo0J family partition protein [Flavobacteriaceae bacterium]|nr:ParB/RepB/Spo0J family partition protein [Flavobacteriaceae bacterium]